MSKHLYQRMKRAAVGSALVSMLVVAAGLMGASSAAALPTVTEHASYVSKYTAAAKASPAAS